MSKGGLFSGVIDAVARTAKSAASTGSVAVSPAMHPSEIGAVDARKNQQKASSSLVGGRTMLSGSSASNTLMN